MMLGFVHAVLVETLFMLRALAVKLRVHKHDHAIFIERTPSVFGGYEIYECKCGDRIGI